MLSSIGSPIEPHLKFNEITTSSDAYRTFISSRNTLNWTESFKELCAQKLFNSWSIPKERNINTDVFFITSRESKVEEVRTLMGLNIIPIPLKLPTLDQEVDLVKIAVYRVFKGFKKIQAPCFIEETALNIDDSRWQRPFPGNQYRVVVEQQIGKHTFAADQAGKSATTLSVFAYTEDGKTAYVFTGECKGKIAPPTHNWVDVDGWDPFFIPNGYKQTLAELREFKHILNMRLLPCAEMRSVMRHKAYKGVYEVHITVYNCGLEVLQSNGYQNCLEPSEEYVKRFKEACNHEELKVKPLFIRMDDPKKPVQLQTAAYHCFAKYAEAVEKTHKAAQVLQKLGLPVLRVRLEAMLSNQDCPKTDEEALLTERSHYFEFHARIEEVSAERLDEYKDILAKRSKKSCGTHSKGKIDVKFSTVGDGSRYFCNMRCYSLGSQSALREWNGLLDALREQNFAIAKIIKPEYCVYDEKPHLDNQTIQGAFSM